MPWQPSPLVQSYERLRSEFINGCAPREDIRTLIYHGLFHGLQSLSTRDRTDRAPPDLPSSLSDAPASCALPEAVVRQLATLFLTRHPETVHAH